VIIVGIITLKANHATAGCGRANTDMDKLPWKWDADPPVLRLLTRALKSDNAYLIYTFSISPKRKTSGVIKITEVRAADAAARVRLIDAV